MQSLVGFPRWLSGPPRRLTPSVRRPVGIGVTAIVALAMGACGGGSSNSAASLKPYVVEGNEETGYAIQRPLEHFKTAKGYAAGVQQPGLAQHLTREGFQQALIENTADGNGLSFVMQFATAADARREQSFELLNEPGQPLHFSVPGVPGSRGFGVRAVGQQGDANVLFTEGRCLLLVGDLSTPHPNSYEQAVIAGVQAIYARTARHDGACSG